MSLSKSKGEVTLPGSQAAHLPFPLTQAPCLALCSQHTKRVQGSGEDRTSMHMAWAREQGQAEGRDEESLSHSLPHLLWH